MKAILVIDLEANELPIDAYANIYIFGKEEQENRFLEFIKRTPLKPMPNRIDWLENGYNGDWIMFSTGWNACIEELEK